MHIHYLVTRMLQLRDLIKKYTFDTA
jgi:hypothetical protein